MKSKKQSSIEWLKDELFKWFKFESPFEFKQAKEKHKQEILNSYNSATEDMRKYFATSYHKPQSAEEYYKNTYETSK